MTPRSFVDSPIHSERVIIKGSEAHHLQHVLRARVDDVVRLFDGSGQEFTAHITRLDRGEVSVLVLAAVAVDRELPARWVIGTALPKGERQRWLTEKLVEMGIAELIPLRTSRSVVHPDHRASAKLIRSVIEASKQCGRNRLMRVSDLRTFDAYIHSVPHDARRLLADPSGQPLATTWSGEQETYLAVGPEGGFTAEELATASAVGWQLVSLGPRILRIETACLVLAARTIAWDTE